MEARQYVNARQAADMTGYSERQIRRKLKDGDIAGAIKDERGREWRIPTSSLKPLRKRVRERAAARGDLAGEVAALRAEVAALRTEAETLRQRPRYSWETSASASAPVRASTGEQVAAPVAARPLSAALSDSRLSAFQGHAGHGGRPRKRTPAPGDDFTTATEAIAWLRSAHCNAGEGTPKSWPGWQEVTLTKTAVLRLAIANRDGNHRRPWRLYRCTDTICVCQTMLAEG